MPWELKQPLSLKPQISLGYSISGDVQGPALHTAVPILPGEGLKGSLFFVSRAASPGTELSSP